MRKELEYPEIDRNILMKAEEIAYQVYYSYYDNDIKEAEESLSELNNLIQQDLNISDFEIAMTEMEIVDWAESLLIPRPKKTNISEEELLEIINIILSNDVYLNQINYLCKLIEVSKGLPSNFVQSLIDRENVDIEYIFTRINTYKPIIL